MPPPKVRKITDMFEYKSNAAENAEKFLGVKLLKIYIRNSCKQERLCGLAMMAMHKNIPLDYATIVAKLLNAKPRRIET